MLASDELILLPPLRQNLKLLPAPADEEGEPRWQLFDALSNKFYFLSRTALYLFREWRNADDDQALLARVAQRGVEVSKEELDYFIQFLKQNNLIEVSEPQAVLEFEAQVQRQKKHLLLWILHNYLFIKIPLVRPDLALTRFYQRYSLLLNFPLHWFAGGFGLLGAVMVLRQWETFTHTLQNFFSFSSIIYYAGALILVKTAHELGHALVAKRYGCRVGSMGVAFLLMTPILYTDTTEAWRLRSRFQRLDIVTAGVRVEIYIACFATFLWAIVPAGSFRDVLFFVATTSWLSSLFINISPFMRFDGYYALSDFLGMENLQPRAFLVGKWFLRERIFGLGLLPPEPLNRKKCALMVVYAWSTWIYRLFLFLGIALLVYYFTFKLLGIVLFTVEILWFVLLPIVKEVGVWVSLRDKMQWNKRSVFSVLLVAAVILLVVIPWRGYVSVPAITEFERQQVFYPSSDGKISVWEVVPNKQVESGKVLAIIESPELEQNIAITDARIERLSLQWQRSRADALLRGESASVQAQLSREQSRLSTLLERREELVLKSPLTGVIGRWGDFRVGDFVSTKTPLVTVYDPTSVVVRAYISGDLLNKLDVGAEGQFVADKGEFFNSPVALEGILPTAAEYLEHPSLSSTFGGPIAATTHNEQEVPDEAVYQILLRFEETPSQAQQLTGIVRLPMQPSSIFMDAMRRLYGIAIRESGF